MSYWQEKLDFWERQLRELEAISIKDGDGADLPPLLTEKYQQEIWAAQRQVSRIQVRL